jgi:hypothetical protein
MSHPYGHAHDQCYRVSVNIIAVPVCTIMCFLICADEKVLRRECEDVTRARTVEELLRHAKQATSVSEYLILVNGVGFHGRL